MGYAGPPTPSYRSLMIFIDGGYLRNNVIKMVGNDNIIFQNLTQYLSEISRRENIKPDLIRIYYYDAIVDNTHSDYSKQKSYFDDIQKLPMYEVRLGRIKASDKKDKKQKGVDVLLAIDMLSKAYLNHYEWGLILAGDDDFLDLVKTIKNTTGKQVFGAYFEKHISKELILSFDKSVPLKKDKLLEKNCIVISRIKFLPEFNFHNFTLLYNNLHIYFYPRKPDKVSSDTHFPGYYEDDDSCNNTLMHPNIGNVSPVSVWSVSLVLLFHYFEDV